jgi:tetratricopeptide (TPR) repeat protein
MQNNQQLPPKEQALFRQLVVCINSPLILISQKYYESKQYKKGVKSADSILKHYPDHGETICMKGLLLNSLDQKEEALHLAKDGLKKNLKSHVCWHVLGLIYRSDRNYHEATKCYKSALRMDPGNPQIMRDLSLLQLHQRDLEGYTDTRRQLLALKPAVKQNWLSFVVAEHLRGSPNSALEVMDKMEEAFVGQDEPMSRVEKSEMLLYKASLCLEAGNFERAINTLNSKDIVDSVGRDELLVYIFYRLEDVSACKQTLKNLLRVNSSHEGYMKTLVAASGIVHPKPSPDDVKKFLRLDDSGYVLSSAWESFDSSCSKMMLTSNSKLNPTDLLESLLKLKEEYVGEQRNSDQFELLVLSLLPGESGEFAERVRKFVDHKLSKGVPSTFKLLKRFCNDNHKSNVIRSLLEELSDSRDANPIKRTFALMSLGAFYDWKSEHAKALSLVENAISMTPTLIDLYVLKAKIFKHSGDLKSSAEVWEYARQLDLADRYLNSKSVKGMLRIGEINKAKEVIQLFARDATDASKSNLSEMQCMWWEFELGKALEVKGDIEGARKVWQGTLKHYEDMAEDEFDFALYCLRKMTLRAYVDFLRFVPRMKTHKFYRRTVLALDQLEK